MSDLECRVVREMNATMKKNHLSAEQATFDLSTRKGEDNSGHQVSLFSLELLVYKRIHQVSSCLS